MVDPQQIRRTVCQPRIDSNRIAGHDDRFSVREHDKEVMKHLAIMLCLMQLCWNMDALVLAAEPTKVASPMDAEFEKLAAAFIVQYPALSPISATSLGDHR